MYVFILDINITKDKTWAWVTRRRIWKPSWFNSMLVLCFFPLVLCGMWHTNKLSVIVGNSMEHFKYPGSTGFSQSRVSSACLKKLIPAVSIAARHWCEFWEKSESCRFWNRKQSIGVCWKGDIGALKNSSQSRLRQLSSQWRGERLLELNNAVPVTAGRGHWKAVDVLSFLILQSYIYGLPWLFTCICLLLISSGNFVEEIFVFLQDPCKWEWWHSKIGVWVFLCLWGSSFNNKQCCLWIHYQTVYVDF